MDRVYELEMYRLAKIVINIQFDAILVETPVSYRNSESFYY